MTRDSASPSGGGEPLFSFCESVWAGPRSPWHIRKRDSGQPLKLGGGIQTGSLCGHVKARNGWDLEVGVEGMLESIRKHQSNGVVCEACLRAYAAARTARPDGETP